MSKVVPLSSVSTGPPKESKTRRKKEENNDNDTVITVEAKKKEKDPQPIAAVDAKTAPPPEQESKKAERPQAAAAAAKAEKVSGTDGEPEQKVAPRAEEDNSKQMQALLEARIASVKGANQNKEQPLRGPSSRSVSTEGPAKAADEDEDVEQKTGDGPSTHQPLAKGPSSRASPSGGGGGGGGGHGRRSSSKG